MQFSDIEVGSEEVDVLIKGCKQKLGILMINGRLELKASLKSRGSARDECSPIGARGSMCLK